jgi:hypothetical protein
VERQRDNKNDYHPIPLCGTFLTRFYWKSHFFRATLKINFSVMKKGFLLACSIVFAVAIYAQDPASAEKGVTYGASTSSGGAVSVNDVEKNMKENKFEGKVTGKVTDVCQEKGCWMKIEKSNGETMMVKFKDYGFFMPKNIVGKEVVIDGEASKKEISVKQLQHYAKDAGKPAEEIKKIKAPKKELMFVAKGVLVL